MGFRKRLGSFGLLVLGLVRGWDAASAAFFGLVDVRLRRVVCVMGIYGCVHYEVLFFFVCV